MPVSYSPRNKPSHVFCRQSPFCDRKCQIAKCAVRKLNDGVVAATGSYDFRFILYDAAVAGRQVGNVLMAENLAVVSGLFVANVDFGAVFDGSSRWIEIAVRPGPRVPAVRDTFPLIPCTVLFLRIILMMPPVPSASYLAPGLVITSML